MADLFRCDKCGQIGPYSHKRGRLIVQEINVHDGQPHASLYNAKAEVCLPCLEAVITSFGGRRNGSPDMAKNQQIMREANEVSGTTNLLGGGS